MGNNLQYKRTHKAIISAFLMLSEKIPFDKITVQDIMDEALVSRYTFYKHFKDKYEIAELLQEQTIEEFTSLIERVRRDSTSGQLDQMAQNELWCQFSKDHREFRALWNIHTDTIDIQKRFRELFKKSYLDELSQSDTSSNRELEADICAAVQTTLMNYFAFEPNMNANNLGEPVREIIINACLHLARLERPQKIKEILNQFV